ncbi:MAG: hypothetical protein Q9190_007568 [Brigantiaea leucoxantha]
MSEQKHPLINPNTPLRRYYGSLESRIGYWLFLGGTRHFGYYASGVWWPFPINAALRRMEDCLFNSLNLKPGAKVLDAGCGVGHVALHMAGKGLQILGIDVTERHLRWARQNIKARRLEETVSAQLMDYHHLDPLDDASFDGVYTIETLVHATDPESVLAGFFRVLKPGGSLALYEYDHLPFEDVPTNVPKSVLDSLVQVNQRAAMPANEAFSQGVLESMLEKQGFENVRLEDLSKNIKPMVMLFFVVAYVPYMIIRFLGLQRWFVNTQAGVEGYRVLKWKLWRYIAVTARKPGSNSNKTDEVGRG